MVDLWRGDMRMLVEAVCSYLRSGEPPQEIVAYSQQVVFDGGEECWFFPDDDIVLDDGEEECCVAEVEHIEDVGQDGDGQCHRAHLGPRCLYRSLRPFILTDLFVIFL